MSLAAPYIQRHSSRVSPCRCPAVQGEPKTILWMHTTPLPCAVDGWSLRKSGDLVCWRCNLLHLWLTVPPPLPPCAMQGEPKAIPWTHTTPLRCAVDGWSLQDIKPGNVVCWPTNLGWMMGPWLVYASLLNGATIALYQVGHQGGGVQVKAERHCPGSTAEPEKGSPQDPERELSWLLS